MYCSQCGTKLEDDSNFCSFCGHKVEVSEGGGAATSGDAVIEEDTSSDDVGIEKDVSRINATNANAADKNPAASSSATTNLKTAVQNNKRRSRRRVPVIVLVALAVALGAGVAYAAYYVYNEVWLPTQQASQNTTQQFDPQQNQSQTNAQDSQVADDDALTKPENQPIIDAYNKVIEEYKKAIAENPNPESATFTNTEEVRAQVNQKYPNINNSFIINKFEAPSCYAIKDINGDGVPDLLVGKYNYGETPEYDYYKDSFDIYDLVSYQNGEIVHVVERGYAFHHWYLRENGVIAYSSSNDTPHYGMTLYSRLSLGTLLTPMGADPKKHMSLLDEVDFDRNSITRLTADGTKTTSAYSESELNSILEELSNKYPPEKNLQTTRFDESKD